MNGRDAPPAAMDPRAAPFFFNDDPSVHFHVGELLVLDGEVDFDQLGRRLEARLAHFPRWRHRPVAGPLRIAPPRWEDDPGLVLGTRLHRLSIPPPASELELASFTSKVWSWHLDPARVPWEVVLIEGLADRRSAILVKAHRCLVDPLVELASEELLLDRDDLPDTTAVAVRGRRKRRPSALARLTQEIDDRIGEPVRGALREVGSSLTSGLDLGRLLGRTREIAQTAEAVTTLLSTPAPETPFNAPIGPQRRLGWVRFSLPALRAIQEALGGSIEQVLLSILADALGRLLRQMERSTDGLELVVIAPRAGAPRPTETATRLRLAPRSPAGAEGGVEEDPWTTVRREHGLVLLPVGTLSPQARHASVGSALRDLRPGTELALIEQLGSWLLALPTPVQRAMSALAFQSANTMCVRGPVFPEPARVLGRKVDHVATFAPLAWNVGLAFSACQRGESELVLGVNSDPGCLPHLRIVLEALREAYRDLAATAGVPPLDPGLHPSA